MYRTAPRDVSALENPRSCKAGAGAQTPQPRPLTTLIAPELDAEALLRATLDSLSAHIAVLDESGTIIAVNQAWRAFAHASGYADENHGVGMNYLAVCERAAAFSDDAARTAEALREIIGGERTEFRLEYPCRSPEGPRWFQLRVTRPGRSPAHRIVIAHEDITEVKNAQAELVRLSGRILHMQDEERRAIARELHDTTAQNLLAITLNATSLRETLRDARKPVQRAIAETLELAEQSLQEVRTLSYLLHPPLLDDIGLVAALSWLARGFSERSGIKVDIRIDDGGEPLPRATATALFRVAQEALSNVHRHSGSKRARLALIRTEDMVRLEITDEGTGFKRPTAGGGEGAYNLGVGISGMRLRLEQLGGRLDIRSSPSGTRVSASVPAKPDRPAEDEPAKIPPSHRER